MHSAWIRSVNDDYLVSSVVIVNVVPVWLLPSSMKELMSKDLLSVKKPGSFGWGNATPSLLNIRSTDGIAGLSFSSFWTHKRPTSMHLSTSNSKYESSKQRSINSKPLSLFHSSQACPRRLWSWSGWWNLCSFCHLLFLTKSHRNWRHRIHWKLAIYCILRRQITICANYSFGFSFSLIVSKNSCYAKVGYYGVHLIVK